MRPLPERLRPGPARTLWLCAAGAVAGLLLAGLGLFTAHGTRIAGVLPEDVALVNQVPILMADYVDQLRARFGVGLAAATPAQRRQVLDEMIREELYVQRGVELGLPADTLEVRQALVGAVEAQEAADATLSAPDEAALRADYAAHAADYADEGVIALDEYRLPASQAPRARAAAQALRAAHGAPQVAAALGLAATGRMADGAEFYFAARAHLGASLFAEAARLPAGAVSDPLPLPDGLHILAVHANTPPRPAPFALVRDRVLADATARQTRALIGAADRFLRARADIAIRPGYE